MEKPFAPALLQNSVIPHWDRACRELAQGEPALRLLMERFPGEQLSGSGDPFQTLANAIVGQQISVHAAASIWKRLRALLQDVSAQAVLASDSEALRQAGLSRRKVEYIQGLAESFLEGRIQPELWPGKDDSEVIRELSSQRGIGRWTAEMFLIFHLHRPDVLPLDDIGLLRAAGHFLEQGPPMTARELEQRAQGWRPWRTVATWYLWRGLDPESVIY